MQNMTETNLTNSPVAASLYSPAILADPDFLNGFEDGVDAYEGECEQKGRKLTHVEVSADVRRNLDPRLIAKSKSLDAFLGCQATPMYDAGFMAGWIYAHMMTPDPVATTRDTQPQPAKIIPLRMQ